MSFIERHRGIRFRNTKRPLSIVSESARLRISSHLISFRLTNSTKKIKYYSKKKKAHFFNTDSPYSRSSDNFIFHIRSIHIRKNEPTPEFVPIRFRKRTCVFFNRIPHRFRYLVTWTDAVRPLVPQCRPHPGNRPMETALRFPAHKSHPIAAPRVREASPPFGRRLSLSFMTSTLSETDPREIKRCRAVEKFTSNFRFLNGKR